MDFIRNAWPLCAYFRQCLKTNPVLDFAVLTGASHCKESVFSGLNNLEVCSVLSDTYSDVFGFTPGEVVNMASELNITSAFRNYNIGMMDTVLELVKSIIRGRSSIILTINVSLCHIGLTRRITPSCGSSFPTLITCVSSHCRGFYMTSRYLSV